jgi:hypothetical protein
MVQQLYPPDYLQRIQFCNWYNNNLLHNVDQQDITFFSDEGWFHLSGFINSQNYRTWSDHNPHNIIQVPLHPLKIGVWVAMSRRRIIGPIFFHETINAERYRRLLVDPFLNQLDDIELTNGYYQQDSATAHTARATINYLEEFFPGRLISSGLWPSRSPDMTPLDFFLFPYLKNVVFRNPINNLEELQHAIEEAIGNVGPEMLINVFTNLSNRVQLCLQQGGQHFEHLL